MKNIIILAVLWSPLLWTACSSSTSDEEKGATGPNFVFFYADDLGWTDLGIQGSDFYETPHIDQLARESMRFTNAYANAANCAPSRACLMTGLYSSRHGIYTVGNPDRGAAAHRKLIPAPNTVTLEKKFVTLPQRLKKAGYATCIAGKWHLSNAPKEYGFDENFGGNHSGHPKSYFSPYRNLALLDGPNGEHLPARLSREVSSWIAQHREEPFFVYFPFYSVHTPIQAREDLTEKYQQKEAGSRHDHPKYAAMIEAMDAAVGKVLQTISELELAENTVFIFSSDNGPHGVVSTAKPLRGVKGMYYEGGIRVPLFIKWPGVVSPNTENQTPVMGMDLFTTIVEIADAPLPDYELDGKSLLPLLRGGKIPARALYWHFPAYLQATSTKNRAMEDSHDPPHWRTTPCSAIRLGNWKLIEYFENGDLELYNLADDQSEQKNLATTNVLKRNELHEALKKWRRETEAPVPSALNPEYDQ